MRRNRPDLPGKGHFFVLAITILTKKKHVFLQAADKGDTALVRWLLTLPGVTANVTDSAGKKPIDYVNKEKFPYVRFFFVC